MNVFKNDQNFLVDFIETHHTPCYVYDLIGIQNKIHQLQTLFDDSIQFLYAVKANPHHKILATMANHAVGADVASIGEIKAALSAGIAPHLIEFSGPGKTEDELQFAIQHDIGAINVECLEELETLVNLSQTLSKTPKVALRINPEVSFKTGLTMSGITQFGIPLQQILEQPSRFQNLLNQVEFIGIHTHAGSQVLVASEINKMIQCTINNAEQIETILNMPIRQVNFGGGWGVPYFENQSPLNIKAIHEQLTQTQQSAHPNSLINRIKVKFELGRFLVAEQGLYITKILYVKKINGQTFAVTNGGMHHNYLLAGGMGQVIRHNFKFNIYSQNGIEMCNEYHLSITGKLCTPQDVLISNTLYSRKINPGDYVIFYNCGAYGLLASPQHFLLHDLPNEYVRE